MIYERFSYCTELRQETLVRKHAARKTSWMEDGDDKISQLEKDLKKMKSEKQKLEDVSVHCPQLHDRLLQRQST